MKNKHYFADGNLVIPRTLTRSRKIVIAHSGHRDLVPGDEPRLRQAVEAKLSEITRGACHNYLLLTGFAEGADQLVAATAVAMGIEVGLLILDPSEEEEPALALQHQFGAELVSIRDLTAPDLTENYQTSYERLAHKLLSRAHHLLVLWDGVDATKLGGTSDLVRLAIHSHKRKRRRKRILHQLVTPRLVNPHPICGEIFQHQHAQPPPGTYEWASTHFPHQPTRDRISAWNRYIAYNENFWRFILPSMLVVLTILFGYIGFTTLAAAESPAAGSTAKRLDAFFNAVNLVTFNSSALNTDQEVPLLLNIARFTGLLFVLNAFIVAFMLAIGSNNKNLLRIYLWKLVRFRNIRLIIGLNQLSYPLALALKQQGAEVVVIDKDPDPNLRAEVARRGIRVMSGSAQSLTFLARIQAQRARDYFILEESDEENIRSLHELDRLWAKRPGHTTQKCYIYLKGSRAAEFCSGPGRLSHDVTVITFNFYETISRKLLTRYPADNFSAACHHTEVFIFGFTEMGRQLLLTLLQTAHNDEQHRLRITVFCRNAVEESKKFFQQYPCLWHDAIENPLYEKPHASEIREYVFPRGILDIQELPLSDANYFHNEPITRGLTGSSAVRFYFCLEDAMQNVAYLSSLMPRIGERTNLQLFCHFNLSGDSEKEHTAYMLNRQLPHTPVILFGQLKEECRALATADFRIDDLAALINYRYSAHGLGYGWQSDPRGTLRLAHRRWETLPYIHRESSRRAADHLWTKLRYAAISPYELQQQLYADTGQPIYEKIKAMNRALESKLPLLSRIEQRRWCAEKLLNGFLPLQDMYPDAVNSVATWVERWNDPLEKTFKQYYQSQKLHIDLLPFDKLFEGEITIERKRVIHSEKYKDKEQIKGIPDFLYVLLHRTHE